MIFDDGFFHADPHPGNLFIEPGGRIGLIDFGMVGVIDAELRERLSLLLRRPGAQGSRAHRRRARRDVHLFRSTSTGAGSAGTCGRSSPSTTASSSATSGSASSSTNVLAVLRRHHLLLPHEVSLVFKMVIMTEGMGVSLDPKFSLGATLGPFAQRLLANRYSPANIAQQLAGAGSDAMEILSQLPGQLRRLQQVLDDGGPELHLRTAELAPMLDRLDAMSKRVVFGAVTAALVHGVLGLPVEQDGRRRAYMPPLRGVTIVGAAALAAYYGWASRPRRR